MKTKYYFIFNEGSRVNQIICAILINMPVFVYGAAIGWMSPMTLLLQDPVNSPRDVPLTDSEVSWMAAAAYLVCIPSDFLMAILGDKIGRKNTMFILSLAAFACWAIKLSSMSTWAFILARSLVGVMMGGAYVTCPLYTKEISEDVIRGMLGSMVILFHTIGNLLMYVIGDILSYYTILWICVTLPAIHMVLFTMMPESPSYLVKKGNIEKANKALAWLRCRKEDDPAVVRELDMLKKEQNKDDESNKFVIKAVLTDKILFRAFKIALVVALAREVCGAIPVLNFAGDIFATASKDTGLVLSPNQQAMMLGAVQVVGSVMTFGVVEKVGRKGLLFYTSLISGLSMCALASWFLARDYNVYLPAWLPMVTLCLCIFCDAFGLQPMSVVINAELFSFKYRGTIMAATMASASVTDFFQMLFFKPVMKSIGPYVAFYFFGGVCILTAIYTIIAIPETKARSLEEIYEDLKTKKEKRQESEKGMEKQKEILA
ncbi:facilitated trehalose transporter Tret1-like [Anticarsia gemmatalis]|uniref:facilitated trehalose transporter Tret1-like n=1 Tax=Anticarsia gemmatalis TaxID=129554 RepID=UPI003F764112